MDYKSIFRFPLLLYAFAHLVEYRNLEVLYGKEAQYLRQMFILCPKKALSIDLHASRFLRMRVFSFEYHYFGHRVSDCGHF